MIHRHKIKREVKSELEAATEKFEKFSQKVVSNFKENKSVNLDSYKELGLRLSTYAIIAMDRYDIANKGLISYLESGVGHFKKELCIDPRLKIKFGEEEFEIESSQKRTGISLFNWWQLLNVAIILRHQRFKEELLELLKKTQEHSHDPFWNRSMDLILMCMGKKDFEESIANDLQSIVNSGVVAFYGVKQSGLVKSEEGKELRKRLWLPIMELYYYAFKSNEESFNNYLKEYLLLKKDWIIENKEEDNSSFWIDFPLLACCAYAYDKGLSINVESDYIPSFVYKGKLN